MEKTRVASFLSVGCDVLAAINCTHLLVAHDHSSCELVELPQGLVVCTESRTLLSSSIDETIATNVIPTLLCDMEFGSVLADRVLVEWFLSASHRIFPSRLVELKPDLIITQLPEGVRVEAAEAALEAVVGRKVRVVCIDVRCKFEGIWEVTIMRIARELLRDNKNEGRLLSDARELIRLLETRINVVIEMCVGRRSSSEHKLVLCLQWDEKWNLFQCMKHAMGDWVSDLVSLVAGEMTYVDDEHKGFFHLDTIISSIITPNPTIPIRLHKLVLIIKNPHWNLEQMHDHVLCDKRFDNLLQVATTSPHSLHLVVAHGPRFLSRPSPFLIVESLETLCEILHPESQPFGHEGSLWCTVERSE